MPLCHLEPILATRCALDLIIRPFPVCSSSKVLLQDGWRALFYSSSTTAGRESIDFATWIMTFKATLQTDSHLKSSALTVTSCYLLLLPSLLTSQTSWTPCLKIFGQLTSSETRPHEEGLCRVEPNGFLSLVFHISILFSLPCFHPVLFLSFFEFMTTVVRWLLMSGCYTRAPGLLMGVFSVLSQTGACPIVIK